MRMFFWGGLMTMAAACADDPTVSVDAQDLAHHHGVRVPNNLPLPNPSGFAATYNVNDDDIDLNGAFFQSFGTNGRVCGTCHQPTDGWSVIPEHIRARFDATDGTDPIFRLNDGSNSPLADVSTVKARRKAYSMVLT